MMTLEEFRSKYCSICGTQRCSGVYDNIYRDGCKKLQSEFPPNLVGVTSTYIKGECVDKEIGYGHRFGDDVTIWFDGYTPLDDEFHLTTIFVR